MATLKSSAALETALKSRSGPKYLTLSLDLPQMRLIYSYDMTKDVKYFDSLIIRLRTEVTDGWYFYEEGSWVNPVLFCSLTVDKEGMNSGFGFELVLEDLHENIIAEFYSRFKAGTLIYKEKDLEGLTEVHPPLKVL